MTTLRYFIRGRNDLVLFYKEKKRFLKNYKMQKIFGDGIDDAREDTEKT